MHIFRWKPMAFACMFSLLSLPNFGCDSEENEDGSEGDHSSHAEGSASHADIPKEFEGKMNPFDASDSDTVAAGKMLYDNSCKSCHGETGKGDGPSAGGLDHPPPDLTDAKAAGWADDFLLYVLSDGIPDEGMPGFKGSLSEDELWQIITYMRSLQG